MQGVGYPYPANLHPALPTPHLHPTLPIQVQMSMGNGPYIPPMGPYMGNGPYIPPMGPYTSPMGNGPYMPMSNGPYMPMGNGPYIPIIGGLPQMIPPKIAPTNVISGSIKMSTWGGNAAPPILYGFTDKTKNGEE